LEVIVSKLDELKELLRKSVHYRIDAGREPAIWLELDIVTSYVQANFIERIEELEHENLCDVCAGKGVPEDGETCMCMGTGKMSVAARHLRVSVIQMEAKLVPLQELAEMVEAELLAHFGSVDDVPMSWAPILEKAHASKEANRVKATG
jgi:hypothetical protein